MQCNTSNSRKWSPQTESWLTHCWCSYHIPKGCHAWGCFEREGSSIAWDGGQSGQYRWAARECWAKRLACFWHWDWKWQGVDSRSPWRLLVLCMPGMNSRYQVLLFWWWKLVTCHMWSSLLNREPWSQVSRKTRPCMSSQVYRNSPSIVRLSQRS